MVKLSNKEVLNLKLKSIPVDLLKAFCLQNGITSKSKTVDLIKSILQSNDQIDDKLNIFIKEKYLERINNRRSTISDDDLKKELLKVQNFNWGVVQGQLDQKIQTQYIRKIFKYDDLIFKVKATLHNDVTNYVICTWFNHWTTVLIEEHIAQHPKVIPTLKNIKGIDLFFNGQPFDLKVTYLPKGYNPNDAIKNPIGLAKWLYENQGAQRFGDDNRIFVVLFDRNNPDESWKLKRDFDFIFKKIDQFLDKETITSKDEIVFAFRNKTYTAITKILLITK